MSTTAIGGAISFHSDCLDAYEAMNKQNSVNDYLVCRLPEEKKVQGGVITLAATGRGGLDAVRQVLCEQFENSAALALFRVTVVEKSLVGNGKETLRAKLVHLLFVGSGAPPMLRAKTSSLTAQLRQPFSRLSPAHIQVLGDLSELAEDKVSSKLFSSGVGGFFGALRNTRIDFGNGHSKLASVEEQVPVEKQEQVKRRASISSGPDRAAEPPALEPERRPSFLSAPEPERRASIPSAPEPERRASISSAPEPERRASIPSAPEPERRASIPSAPEPERRASVSEAPEPERRASLLNPTAAPTLVQAEQVERRSSVVQIPLAQEQSPPSTVPSSSEPVEKKTLQRNRSVRFKENLVEEVVFDADKPGLPTTATDDDDDAAAPEEHASITSVTPDNVEVQIDEEQQAYYERIKSLQQEEDIHVYI